MDEPRDGTKGVPTMLRRDHQDLEGDWGCDPYAVDAAEKWRPFMERDVSAPDEAWFARHLGEIHAALGYRVTPAKRS